MRKLPCLYIILVTYLPVFVLKYYHVTQIFRSLPSQPLVRIHIQGPQHQQAYSLPLSSTSVIFDNFNKRE